MSASTTWIYAFLSAYGAYCLYWAFETGRTSPGAGDFLVGGRETSPAVFVLAATGLSLTGWIAMGHPSMIYRGGFPFAGAALAAVVIPLASILFLKRQWVLGSRFGYATQGELLADYYSGEAMRIVSIGIALVFAVPFVGMQLIAQGGLVEAVTAGSVDRHTASWVLGFIVFLYACIGGFRAVTFIGTLQTLLVLTGMIGLGIYAYAGVGGFAALNTAMAKLAATPEATSAGLFAIPAVLEFTAGVRNQAPPGSLWTTAMIFSYCLALAGIAASPATTALGLSCRNMRGFAAQQVWTLGGVVGIVLLFFAVGQGMAAHFLMPDKTGAYADLTAPYLVSLGRTDPWFAALFALCALAGLQLAAAIFVTTAATTLTLDLYRRFVRPTAPGSELKLAARIAIACLFLLALVCSTFAPSVTAAAGTLALPFAAQLAPALAGVCWYRWITRQAATLGTIVGLVAVVLTEPLGGMLSNSAGFDLPWGRWPWTIHSAGWGLFCNCLTVAFVSLATRGGEARQHRHRMHDLLEQHAGLSPRKRVMKQAVWALGLAWAFFAFGPGAILGNHLLGKPEGGLESWRFGVPSLWAWQVVWWALGMLLIWWLAYKMELSTEPRRVVEADTAGRAAVGGAVQPPQWIRNLLRRIT